jgi:glycosyltransferase involved in cell wall biosynthesis
MKIHFICNDGSPIDVSWSTIFDRGVGGAELALFSLAEQFAKDGHDVTIYNQSSAQKGPFEEAGITFMSKHKLELHDDERILIIFRSPNPMAINATAKRRIWWSTDQQTSGSFHTLARQVEFCVTISPYHTKYHQQRYKIPQDHIKHIDLGVRDEYAPLSEVKKTNNLSIFCSVPSRGLVELYGMWPTLQREIPDIRLIITSDYRLWGEYGPGNHQHRLMWSDMTGVDFVGKVDRLELVEYQLASELLIYPCTYEELFCVSVAECQVAGAYPITSKMGALIDTNRWGTIIEGDPRSPDFTANFVARAVSLLTTERSFLEEQQEFMAEEARKQFSWKRIAEEWYELFENGRIEK